MDGSSGVQLFPGVGIRPNDTLSGSEAPLQGPRPGMPWKRDAHAAGGPREVGDSGWRQMGRQKASWREEEAFKPGTSSLWVSSFMYMQTVWGNSEEGSGVGRAVFGILPRWS